MSELPVYGWNEDGRHRCIVAAKSRAAAGRAYIAAGGEPRGLDRKMRDYGCTSMNPEELHLARSKPGAVFRKAYQHGAPWVEVAP